MSEAPLPVAAGQETVEQKRLEFRSKMFGGLVYVVARLIFKSLRMTTVNLASLDRPSNGTILVTWHGRTLLCANMFRNRGYWALISWSRDGEIQNNIFQRCGFQTIRGSTGRGGVRAALQMARKIKEGGTLAFTPDGPRGPTHKVQPGVILIAEKSGAPIVPVGVSASRRWLVKSWDSYMVPKPFAKGVLLIGEPIHIPSGLTEQQRAEYCILVENAINAIECEAERLAGFAVCPET